MSHVIITTNKQKELELTNNKAEIQIKYLKQQIEQDKQFRKLKHEQRNQITYMRYLLEKKDYNELNNYFNTLYEQYTFNQLIILSPDTLLNSIIYSIDSKAQKYNISVQKSIDIYKPLKIKGDHLVSIIMNLAENALESCIKENIHSYMLEIKSTKSYYFIKTSNKASINPLLNKNSTKQNKRLHGFGNNIIDEIIKANNGIIERNYKNQIYSVLILLPIPHDN